MNTHNHIIELILNSIAASLNEHTHTHTHKHIHTHHRIDIKQQCSITNEHTHCSRPDLCLESLCLQSYHKDSDRLLFTDESRTTGARREFYDSTYNRCTWLWLIRGCWLPVKQSLGNRRKQYSIASATRSTRNSRAHRTVTSRINRMISTKTKQYDI